MPFDPFKDGGATELTDTDFDPFKDGGATELGEPQNYFADKGRRLGRAIPKAIGDTVASAGSAVQSGAELAAEALRWRAVRSGDMTEAEAAAKKQEFLDRANQTAPLQAAQAVRDVGQEITDVGPRRFAKPDPARDSEIGSAVVSGAASLAPLLAAGAINPALAIAAGGGYMGETQRQDAAEKGASPTQQAAAFMTGAPVGAASEALLGVPQMLKSVGGAKLLPALLGKAEGGLDSMMAGLFTKMAPAILPVAQQAVKSAVREGVQEGMEQIAQNTLAKDVVGYDPKRDRTEGAGMAMLAGSIVGGGVGAAAQASEELAKPAAQRALEAAQRRTGPAQAGEELTKPAAQRDLEAAQRQAVPASQPPAATQNPSPASSTPKPEPAAAAAATAPNFVEDMLAKDAAASAAAREAAAKEDAARTGRQTELAEKKARFDQRLAVARSTLADPAAPFAAVDGALNSITSYAEDNALGLTQTQREQALQTQAALQKRHAQLAPAAQAQADTAAEARRTEAKLAEDAKAEKVRRERAALQHLETTGRDLATGEITDLTAVPDEELGALDANAEGLTPQQIEAEQQRRGEAAERAAATSNEAGYTLRDLILGKKSALAAAGLTGPLRLKSPAALAVEGGTMAGEHRAIGERQGGFRIFSDTGLAEDTLQERLQSLGFMAPDVTSAYALYEQALGGEEIRPERGEEQQVDFAQGKFETVQQLSDTWNERGVKNVVTERNGLITLAKIIVPEGQRGEGHGSQFMRDLSAHADATRQTIALTPSTDFGATSKGRLQKFYRQFGFGKNNDFAISEAMTRQPRPDLATTAQPATPRPILTDAQVEQQLAALRREFPALTRDLDLRAGLVADELKRAGYTGPVPAGVQAAILRLNAEKRLLVIATRAMREGNGGGLFLHEMAHPFFDALPPETKTVLRQLHAQEMSTRTGPLFTAGRLTTEIKVRAEDFPAARLRVDPDLPIKEWFAERTRALNADWLAGRTPRDHSTLVRVWRELLAKLRSLFAQVRGIDPDADLFTTTFRTWLNAGARADSSDAGLTHAGLAYATRQKADFASRQETATANLTDPAPRTDFRNAEEQSAYLNNPDNFDDRPYPGVVKGTPLWIKYEALAKKSLELDTERRRQKLSFDEIETTALRATGKRWPDFQDVADYDRTLAELRDPGSQVGNFPGGQTEIRFASYQDTMDLGSTPLGLTLPNEIRNLAPRWQDKTLQFDSSLDKALYYAGGTPGELRTRIIDSIAQQTQLSPGEIATLARELRQKLAPLARPAATNGTVRVPAQMQAAVRQITAVNFAESDAKQFELQIDDLNLPAMASPAQGAVALFGRRFNALHQVVKADRDPQLFNVYVRMAQRAEQEIGGRIAGMDEEEIVETVNAVGADTAAAALILRSAQAANQWPAMALIFKNGAIRGGKAGELIDERSRKTDYGPLEAIAESAPGRSEQGEDRIMRNWRNNDDRTERSLFEIRGATRNELKIALWKDRATVRQARGTREMPAKNLVHDAIASARGEFVPNLTPETVALIMQRTGLTPDAFWTAAKKGDVTTVNQLAQIPNPVRKQFARSGRYVGPIAQKGALPTTRAPRDFAQQADIEFAEGAAPTLPQPWPQDLRDAQIMTSVAALRAHEMYREAKAGSADHAWFVVTALSNAVKLKALHDQHPDALLAPVRARERQGKNALPPALASAMATAHPSWTIDQEIAQRAGMGHTDATALARLANPAQFDGAVQAGKSYILLDDVLTSGSTINALRAHIEAGGGRVVAVTALAASGNPQTGAGQNLAPRPDVLQKLDAKFGREQIKAFLQEQNIAESSHALTNSQARYLLTFATLDRAGTALTAARISRDRPTTQPNRSDDAGATGRIEKADTGEAGRVDFASQANEYVAANGTPAAKIPAARADIERLLGVVQDEQLELVSYDGGNNLPRPDADAARSAPAPGATDLRRAAEALKAPTQPDVVRAAYGIDPADPELKGGERISSIIPALVADPKRTWDIRGAKIATARDVMTLVTAMRSPYVETAKIILLNRAGVVVHSEVVGVGSLSAAVMDASQLAAVLNRAPQTSEGYDIIFSHNHPGGNPEAGEADYYVTRTLRGLLDRTKHNLRDHVITNGDTYFSYAERNWPVFRFSPHDRPAPPWHPTTPPSPVTTQAPAARGRDADTQINPGTLAPWEIVGRNDLYAATSPTATSQLIASLRQVDPTALHIIYLNRRNLVVALERVPKFKAAAPTTAGWEPWQPLITKLTEGFGREGSNAFVLAAPDTMTSREAAQLMREMKDFSEMTGFRLIDFTAKQFTGDGTARSVGIMEPAPSVDFATGPQTDTPEFKAWFGASKVVDAQGQPLVVFHQTTKKAEADIFAGPGFSTDAAKARARLNDEQVPNGIFFKPTPADIQVGSPNATENTQIPVFLSLKNPLTVENREALAYWIMSRNHEYFKKNQARKKIDAEFEAQFDRIWKLPDATEGVPARRDVEKSAALDRVLAEWDAATKQTAAEMRALIDRQLLTDRHDGVIITEDVGSFKRKTKTFIALDSKQVKSATRNRGTFDPTNPRIDFATGNTPQNLAEIEQRLAALRNSQEDPAELALRSRALEAERDQLQRDIAAERRTAQVAASLVDVRHPLSVVQPEPGDAWGMAPKMTDGELARERADITNHLHDNYAGLAPAMRAHLNARLNALAAEQLTRGTPLGTVTPIPKIDRQAALRSELARGRALRDEGDKTGNAAAQAEGVRLVKAATARLDEEFPGWDAKPTPETKAAPTRPPLPPEPPTAEAAPANEGDGEQSPFSGAEEETRPVRPGKWNEVYGHSAYQPSFLLKTWRKIRDVLTGIKGPIPELPSFPAARWNKSDTFIAEHGPQFYARVAEGERSLKGANDYLQRTAEEQLGRIITPLLKAEGKFNADDYAQLRERQEQARRLKAEGKPTPPGVLAEIAALNSKMESSPYVLFNRLVLALDLHWRATNLKDNAGNAITLPAGINAAETTAELRRLGERIAAGPHAALIQTAVEQHVAMVSQVAADLKSRELLAADHLANPYYFPHLTLETTRGGKVEQRELTPSRVRPGTEADFRGYLETPVGSTKAIEHDYVRAMYYHLVQVGAHNFKADAVRDYFRPYDIKATVERRAKELAKARGVPVSWEQAFAEEFAPRGYVKYGTDSRDAFPTLTVNRDLLARRLGVMLTSGDLHAQLKELNQTGVKLLPEDIRESLSQGERETWIVPARVAEALRGIADRLGKQDNAIEAAAKFTLGIWKGWKLFMPWNHIRYEYGNVVADLEKLLSSSPGTFKYLPGAAKELRAFWQGGTPSADLRTALKEGVINAITAQELDGLTRLKAFEAFQTRTEKARAIVKRRGSSILYQPATAALGLGDFSTPELSALREAITRYAHYQANLDAIRNGARPAYGGAYWKNIEAMTDSRPGANDAAERKAAAISKATFGDYGDLSVLGQAARDKYVPFYSWMEINFRYHANLFRNLRDMVREGETTKAGAAKTAALTAAGFTARAAGGIALRLALPYLAVALWNASGDRDELEKLLSEEDRRRFHIILGRDDQGKVMVVYGQTALMDVMKWVSGPKFAQAMGQWFAGKTDFTTAAATWRDAILPDLANNTIGSFGPFAKIPYALGAKKSTFPDVTDQRTIPAYDMHRHIWSQVTDEFTADQIERIVNKDYYGSKDLGAWAKQLIFQVRQRDPESWAFYAIKDKANDYLEKRTGTKRDSSLDAPDQQVLRNFRRAIYRGDADKAVQFYQRLLDYGYTAERFQASIRSQDPLSALPKENGLRAQFVAGLTPDDRALLDRAYVYYQRIAAGRGRESQLFPTKASGYAGQMRYQAQPRTDALRAQIERVDGMTDEEREQQAQRDERRSLQKTR